MGGCFFSAKICRINRDAGTVVLLVVKKAAGMHVCDLLPGRKRARQLPFGWRDIVKAGIFRADPGKSGKARVLKQLGMEGMVKTVL
jgi:hypothetical protein